jgi:phosphopantothenoylcysteine decarboxylase/phosphopantothenate--cysteine ligase
MSEIVVGVCGGIAAYKTASLVRLFTESGNSVTVVPTASALKFVGAPTWEALSGRPVSSEVFESVDQVRHVKIGQAADLVVVAPTTANVLAKAAHGLADDLLTNTLLTTRGPVVFAPAMHTEMWENPATQANVHTLRQRGHVVLEPSIGRLTGVDTGKGRLPEPVMIFEVCRDLLDRRQGPDLRGLHVVVSAGGTREYLDPVRYIGNRSSGLQGYALAQAAAGRFHDLVAALFKQVLDQLHVHVVVLDHEHARTAIGFRHHEGFFAAAGFAASGKNFGSKSTLALLRIASTLSSVFCCCTRRVMPCRTCSSGWVLCAPALKMWIPYREGTGSLI